MNINKVVIKNNPTFPDSIECTVEMSDDLGECYAFSMSAGKDCPPRVLVEACVQSILVRSVKNITDRYYERTTQC